MRTPIFAAICFIAVSCSNRSTTDKTDADTTVIKDTDTIKTSNPPVATGNDTIFTAFGNEPFWALYVIRGQKLVFHPADGPDVQVPWVEPVQTDAQTQRYSSAGDSAAIELNIVRKDCSDGMSDLVHHFETNVKVNAVSYHGCGRE